MSDPNDLASFLDEAWQHIQRGVADRKAPARYPTFATVSAEGWPEQRTVALRKASRSEGLLEVHTDTATPKVTALRRSPYAGVHIWVPKADLQIRMLTRVEILTGPKTAEDWERVPESSRVSYGTEPIPGTPIPSVFAYEKPPNPNRFAVLRCVVTSVDLVHLGPRHRRACYARADDWAGSWLAP